MGSMMFRDRGAPENIVCTIRDRRESVQIEDVFQVCAWHRVMLTISHITRDRLWSKTRVNLRRADFTLESSRDKTLSSMRKAENNASPLLVIH
jgi:hypothetical protein